MFKIIVTLLLLLALIQCGQSPDSVLTPTMNQAPTAPDLPPPEGIVATGAEWETLAQGYVYSEGPAADADGNVYYAEVTWNHLYKVDAAGKVVLVDEDTAMTMGLVMGADGLIYACRNHDAQIVRYIKEGQFEVLLQGELTPLPNQPNAPGEFCNDLAINSTGGIWFTDRINQRVMYLDRDGSVRSVAEGFRPNGIVLSADRQTLVVTESIEPRLHAFSLGERGSLNEKTDYFDPIMIVRQIGEEKIAPGRPGTDGMTVDDSGRYYVASFYGIQIFERDGSYLGVIKVPKGFVSNLTFGGPGYGWLYATGRNGFYRLKMQVQGVGW